jgi:hypothetical protein
MKTAAPIEIRLRIPGTWANPGEMVERLPSGYSITREGFSLPDGSEILADLMPADTVFPAIFRQSCRQHPSPETLGKVDNYKFNVGLVGPGGSMESASKMVQLAAALITAGGAGVFIDNGALSHSGEHWMEIAEDGGPDALSFAFVSIVRGKQEIWTMGMHVFGLKDIVMHRDVPEEQLVDTIVYMCTSEEPIEDGHLIGDEDCPRYRATACDMNKVHSGSPMHNPFGHLKFFGETDIAECN